MHLAVDAVGNTTGGGISVLRELLEVFSREEAIGKITLFTSPGVRLDEMDSNQVDVVDVQAPHRSYPQRVWWYLSSLKHQATQRGADALLCMNGMGLGPGGIPTYHFVQQSLPFSSEALATFPRSARIKFGLIKRLTMFSLKRSDGVFVQTPWMRDLISRCLGPRVPVEVIIPGTARTKESHAACPRGCARLLYVGSASPHKNLARMILGFTRLKNRLPEAELFLTLDPCRDLAVPGVVFLGHLSTPELLEQYRMAQLLIMPSLVETVGLPLVEALSMGTPVIAADRPYAHDVCGDAARYFDPHSPESICETAYSVLAHPESLQAVKSRVGPRYSDLERAPSYEALVSSILAG